MRLVQRYAIPGPIAGVNVIMVPGGSLILSVREMAGSPDSLEVYALSSDSPYVERKIHLLMDGAQVSDDVDVTNRWQFMGSIQTASMLWHIFVELE